MAHGLQEVCKRIVAEVSELFGQLGPIVSVGREFGVVGHAVSFSASSNSSCLPSLAMR